MDAATRVEVVANLRDGARGVRRFYVLLALSTTIAAFGLLANSAAVIIGAMIVAPLMGPILGLSLGMVSGDHTLERDALFAEVTGVALAILIGLSVGNIPFDLGITPEMLSRTSPTAFDLCVAIAAGLAGAYASVKPKINSAFAGVAIAVALVPPLATTGLLIATGNPKQAFGAFLLFLANFFSIQVASAAVFALFGLGRSPNGAPLSLRRVLVRFAPGVVALLLMTWYMTGTLAALVKSHQTEETLRAVLSEQIAHRTGGQLDRILRTEETPNSYQVVASALTPTVFQPHQVREMESDLEKALHHRVSLVLRSIISQDMDHDGRVYLTNEELQRFARATEEASYLENARTCLSDGLASVQGAWLAGLERRQEGEANDLIATVQGPRQIDRDEVTALEEALARRLNDSVHLIIRNVATRDVDSHGFLYEERLKPLEQSDPELFRIRERVRTVLNSRLAAKTARSLRGLQVQRSGRWILVQAEAEATLPVRPPEVAKMQADLRRYVNSSITLSVHTELAATATGSGWEH